jgi:predicted metalloprotease with PDZ domain
MRVKGLLAVTTLALLALAGSGPALAGGPDCDHGKDATTAHHDCTMSQEECAKAMKEGGCAMSAEECAAGMKKAMATRGWLGIEKEETEEGMVISAVVPGSPAEQAGLQAGDKVVSINGVAVNDGNHDKLHGMMKNAKIGDAVTYVVARGGQNVTLRATLARIPESVLEQSIATHLKEDHPVVKN